MEPVIKPPMTVGTAPPTKVMLGASAGIRLGGGDPVKLGFTPVPIGNTKESLFLIIVGKQGSGKNSLAYSAIDEGPVLDMSVIERGTEGDKYMQQYTSKGVMRKVFIPDERDPLNPMEAKRIFEDWQKTMLGLYGFKGTLVVNTIDEIYEIARMAILGKLENVLRRDYGPVNRAMNDILGYFTRAECPTNLTLISKGVDQWVNGETTGVMEYKGFPNAKYMCDAMVAVDKKVLIDPAAADKKAKGQVLLPVEKRFSGTITRSPANTAAEGMTLLGKELTYSYIKSVVLPIGPAK